MHTERRVPRDKVGHIYGDSIDWEIIWAALIDGIPGDLAAITELLDALPG